MDRWNTGDASAFPANSNSAAPAGGSCESRCASSYFNGWVAGLGLGAAYTLAGGPVGFAWAAGSLGAMSGSAGFAACVDACDDDDKCLAR